MKTSKLAGCVGLGLFLFFLMGCGVASVQSTVSAPVTAPGTLTVSPTATTSASATLTAFPTWTASPTLAVSLLTPVAATVTAHALALNEFNAGTEMKRVNIYGTGKLNDMTFSPDGKFLAAATDRGIYLYGGKTFEQVRLIDVNDSVGAIAFSPDGLTIAAAIGGKVSLWSVLSGKKLSTLNGELVYIWTLAYGKGGHLAAVGSTCRNCGMVQDGMIFWDVKTGKQIYAAKDVWHSTKSLAFTVDGKKLAFGGGGLDIIDTESGKLVESYSSSGDLVSEAIDAPLNFIFSRDDALLFVHSNEVIGNQILDLASKERQAFSLCSSSMIRADSLGGCFSKDKIILFDLANGQKISEIPAPGINDDDNLAAFTPDGKMIAYKTEDTVRIIDSQTGSEIKTLAFTSFNNVQTAMIFLNGEQKYAAALQNEDRQVRLIDVETGALLQTYALSNGWIKGFAFRPDGRTVATLDSNKTLMLWDIQSQQVIYETTFWRDLNSPLAFSPDGLNIFFTAPETNFFNFDLVKKGALNSNSENSYYTDVFAQNNYHFNQAGNLILLHVVNNVPELRDIKTNQIITIPFEVVSEKQYMEIEAFATSSDEKFVTFGSTTGIYVWNLATMKQISELKGHEGMGGDGWYGRIRSVFFSPQSNLLVSVGHDGTTRLWDIHTGQQLRLLNVCCSATFTADGRFLLTAGAGVLRVWGIPKR